MFIHGIVRNHGAIVKPCEFRRDGNSFFGFRILLGLTVFVAVVVAIAPTLAMAWGDIEANAFGTGATGGLLEGILLVAVVSVVAGLAKLFFVDVVVSIMYLRRLRVLEAWRVFRHRMLAGNARTVALYMLLKILPGIVIAIMTVFLVLCICCMAIIPYVGSVILLAVLVFDPAYSLYFIELWFGVGGARLPSTARRRRKTTGVRGPDRTSRHACRKDVDSPGLQVAR